MRIRIKHKLVLMFFLLEIVIISGLSYYQFQKQCLLFITQSAENKRNISLQFINMISLSTAGNNYGNIYLPTFIDSLTSISNLIYLEVEGTSSNQNSYQFAYHQSVGKTWRKFHPENYIQSLNEKIEKLSQYLLNKKTDKVKIEFLLQRAIDEKYKYQRDIKNQNRYGGFQYPSNLIDGYLVDEDKLMLFISLPTTNFNGGIINFVYDLSELTDLKIDIFRSTIIEFIVLLSITFPMTLLITHWVIKPIESLTRCLSAHKGKIDIENIPALTAHDEVGDLAREFKTLISYTYTQMDYIEQISIKDPLTDLFNRRHFDDKIEDIISSAKRHSMSISFLFVDIDNFKKYNDNYGHDKGDEALKAVAQGFLDVARRPDDYCFRFGGEEFIIIIVNKLADNAINIAEKIRQHIEDLSIEHLFNDDFNCLTISIGECTITQITGPIKVKDIIRMADAELYKAKDAGRNKVCKKIL
jgi:diguanylate cyclase (GGDEF)-like protein